MMALVYRQLGTFFQQIATWARSLAQQFQKLSIDDSAQLVDINSPGFSTEVPDGVTYVHVKMCGGGTGGVSTTPGV
ncbi:hypothetical protein [Mycolicibacter icosiumassiliensis]|uniref:hypothetical protein n=1 Tax=Mycolicibacter icosiumassiliensis TaxID=1792835 RepID=UPI00082D91E7|nr:hypothetical protein [Mycolicibacter icosiumassiliensis]